MLLAEIREEVVKYAMAKGIVTDEDLLNYDALDNVILVARAIIGANLMARRVKLSGMWYLTTLIEYDQEIQQNAGVTIYEVPSAIGGAYSMFRGEDGCEGGTIVKNPSDYYSNITKQIPKRVRAVIQNSIMEVNSSLTENIYLTAAFTNPSKIVEWNKDYDKFPMDDMYIADLILLLTNNFYKFVIQKPLDTKSDSAETTQTINQK